jgi:son of sevenless-like protein
VVEWYAARRTRFFPSNYVDFIFDKEAELAFAPRISDRQPNGIGADSNSVLDMTHAMMRGAQAENKEWLDTGSRHKQ